MRLITRIWMSLCFILLFQLPSFAAQSNNGSGTLHILYYDNIEYDEDPYQFLNGVPLKSFENHLNFIKQNAYRVIDLNDPMQTQLNTSSNHVKNIAIILNTNDEEAADYAVPLLKRYDFPVNFNVNPLETNNKNIKINAIKSPILNISSNNEATVLIEKILNDETSRFRELFGKTRRSVILEDSFLYLNNKAVFDRYNFDRIYLPTGEANIYGQDQNIYSYINVTSSFTNLDVLKVHLNRQPFHHTNFTVQRHGETDDKNTHIAWGFTVPSPIYPEQENMRCVTSNGEDAAIHAIENRVEIRLPKDTPYSALKVHCTKDIHDKNSNKTDAYQYMMLHEPL